jgi:hypothetical protein
MGFFSFFFIDNYQFDIFLFSFFDYLFIPYDIYLLIDKKNMYSITNFDQVGKECSEIFVG